MKVLEAKFESQTWLTNDLAAMRMVCFAVVTALVCCFGSSLSGNEGAVRPLPDAIALTAIGIAVWHGAYDGVLARPLFECRFGKWWASAFAAGYLFLTGAILIAWHFAPECALVSFLAYSSWHFGTERDVGPLTLGGAATSFAVGALPIAAACHWHADQVSEILRCMLDPAGTAAFAQQLTHACAALLWIIVVVAAAGTVFGQTRRSQATRISLLCLVALELLLFWRCGPVIAFAIYFCLWHSPEHLVSSSVDRAGCYSQRIMIRNLRAGIFPWIASLAGLSVLFAFGPRSFTGYAAALFVLLSALTVPHMALNEMRRSRAHVV